jgi:hypothetical protein
MVAAKMNEAEFIRQNMAKFGFCAFLSKHFDVSADVAIY